MAFMVGMAAGLTSVTAVILGLIAFTSPHNDLGRVYGRLATAFLIIAAIGLWLLFGYLLRRSDPSENADDRYQSL